MPKKEKLIQYLDSLENFELAFLYKYNLDSHLEDTANIIRKYIEDKGLTDDKREALINEYKIKRHKDNITRCSRCHSAKVQTTLIRNSSIYQMRCNVCGLYEGNQKKRRGRLVLEFIRDFILNIGH
ncbi:hypothetical protein [Candidatus Pollutiaquabacter sp.]|jgi:translation initiation factor 2 beta subunit (eIF-2beta)/eIF-5|uniref:hypothetical protein n=1 Tax=Candidatus Pollutiaquabacter sp. TaxID=3416354 RepID=UPI003D09CBB2